MTLCACRPGCLAMIHPDDDVVQTPDGLGLADHVLGAWPEVQTLPLFDIESVAS